MISVRRTLVAVVALAIAVTVGAIPAGAQSRPPNDDFANRIDLGSATSVTTRGSTVGADQYTADELIGVPNEPGLTGRFVWWTWRAPAKGHVRLFTERANYYSTLWAYTGSTPNTMSPVDGAPMEVPNMDSGVEFLARAGEQYHIALGAEFEEPEFYQGRAVLRLEFVAATNAPPAPTISGVVVNTYEQKLTVTFSSVRNATSYEIRSWLPYSGSNYSVATVPRSPATVPFLELHDLFEVQVRGVTPGGVKGAWSDSVTVRPVGIEVFAWRPAANVIEIGWLPGVDAPEYRVYLTDLHSGRQRLLITTNTALTYSNAVSDRSYQIEVWAMRPGERTVRSTAMTIGPFTPAQ